MLNKTARVNNRTLQQLNRLTLPLYRVSESVEDEPENAIRLAGLPFNSWLKAIQDVSTAREENWDVYFEIQGRFK